MAQQFPRSCPPRPSSSSAPTKAARISYRPHDTTLHKSADRDCSLRDATTSLLDGREAMRKHKRRKGRFREKGRESPQKGQRKWRRELGHLSGHDCVPAFLLVSAPLPCSSSSMADGRAGPQGTPRASKRVLNGSDHLLARPRTEERRDHQHQNGGGNPHLVLAR